MFMSSSKRTLLLFHWQADISPWTVSFWLHTAWALSPASPCCPHSTLWWGMMQSHCILSLSSHSKNLPSQLHSAANSPGPLSNPMLPIWTAGSLKVSLRWQGKRLFFQARGRFAFQSTLRGLIHPHQHFCSSVAVCAVPTLSKSTSKWLKKSSPDRSYETMSRIVNKKLPERTRLFY